MAKLAMGDMLSNGALVISASGNVVLVAWRGEYVTWRYDERGATYWGHYHKDIGSASDDFATRVIQAGE